MKQWLIRCLKRMLAYLEPPPPCSLYAASARPLLLAAEATFGPGFGEAKRHYVYARLIDQYPQVSKRLLARAIEDALD